MKIYTPLLFVCVYVPCALAQDIPAYSAPANEYRIVPPAAPNNAQVLRGNAVLKGEPDDSKALKTPKRPKPNNPPKPKCGGSSKCGGSNKPASPSH